MQVDAKEAKCHTSPAHSTADAIKGSDIPSSPDSTAQTATTSAVHDGSVNTSPENENDSFVDAEEKSDRRNSQGRAEGQALGDVARDDAVEAQLLQESAAAGESRAEASRVPTLTPTAAATSTVAAASTAAAAPDSNSKDQQLQQQQQQKQSPAPAEPTAASAAATSEAPSNDMDVDDAQAQTQDTTKEDAVAISTASESTKAESKSEAPITTAGPTTKTTATTTTTTTTTEQSVPVSNSANSLAGFTHQAASPSVLATLPTPKPSTVDVNENLNLGDLVAASRRKEKRRAPTVLFGKQKKTKPDTTIVPSNLAKSENLFAEDYFTPLFVQTFASNSKWLKNLDQLVHHAHKTISSADSQASIFDNQSCKILKRVYHLQQQDKWSLRQPKRVPEPPRQKSHWDVMLQEMKWMRTDFREERKWKRSVARNLAMACAQWVQATPQERKMLQVSASIPPRRDAENDDFPMIDNAMIDAAQSNDDAHDKTAAPDLDEVDLVDDGDFSADVVSLSATVAPSAIFALQDDAVVFELNPSTASDRLLAELPLFGKPLEVPVSGLTSKADDPDAAWRRPVVPVSKYIDAPIIIKPKQRLQKKSRYAIVDEDDDDDIEEFVDSAAASAASARKGIAAPDNIVGLFDPSLKPMRERLIAGHQFRPPSEYAMPMSGFYEYRPPSQWTVADDDQLKKYVREYSYNWSLTSSLMSSKSLFVSGAERRTPWECFERWVALEGFPSDASRSPYFKIYQSRIDASQKAIKDANEKAAAAAAAAASAAAAAAAAASAAAAQASNAGGSSAPPAPPAPPTPVPRRRPTLPLRVERHRNQKYLATFEAMRKLAKKREAIQHKQQQQAAIVATRKANEPVHPRLPSKTPREYSRLRYERDQKMAERMAEFAQRQNELQRRVCSSAPPFFFAPFLFHFYHGSRICLFRYIGC